MNLDSKRKNSVHDKIRGVTAATIVIAGKDGRLEIAAEKIYSKSEEKIKTYAGFIEGSKQAEMLKVFKGAGKESFAKAVVCSSNCSQESVAQQEQ